MSQKAIIQYVKTLELIFYANLVASQESDGSDWRKESKEAIKTTQSATSQGIFLFAEDIHPYLFLGQKCKKGLRSVLF